MRLETGIEKMNDQLKKHDLRIPVENGTCVHACLIQPGKVQRGSLIVFSHGFTVDGVEVYRLFWRLAGLLADAGYTCLLFDYRGCGYSDLDHSQMTFNTRMQDLNAVLDHARVEFPGRPITVWGVSLGCAVAAHVAAARHDVDRLVLWSLSANLYERYLSRYAKQFSEQGHAYTENGCRVTPALVESLKGRDTFAAIGESGARCLLVHGDADTNTPIELARQAHTLAPHNTDLVEIRGGNHVFISQPEQQDQAIQASLLWLAQP